MNSPSSKKLKPPQSGDQRAKRILSDAPVRLEAADRRNLRPILSALIDLNEAVMHAVDSKDLCQRICQISVANGNFSSALIALGKPGDVDFPVVASAGPMADKAKGVQFSLDKSRPGGSSLSALALRSKKRVISNDYFADSRIRSEHLTDDGSGFRPSAAAFPFLVDEESIGVLALVSGEVNTFTPQLIALFARFADNAAFALDNLAKDKHQERLTRMLAALSATNEAIMRAETRQELLERACDAAALGGIFSSVMITLAEPRRRMLRVVASQGDLPVSMRKGARLPVGPSQFQSGTLTELAFKTAEVCITGDYFNDARVSSVGKSLSAAGKAKGNRVSGGVFPLMKNAEAIGTLGFRSNDPDVFAPDLVELLQRLADNISFAMANFDRIDEKAQADDRINYLATHDGLTGLPNRAMFNQLLATAIETANRYDRQFALLFVDLDRFKIINDTLGHATATHC